MIKRFTGKYISTKKTLISWTQSVLHSSPYFVKSFNPAKNAKIIDICGGGITLVDYLLKEGGRPLFSFIFH
ncbi:MAG: hypothetical protein ABJA76_08360 [Mucilaginibacter sp.]